MFTFAYKFTKYILDNKMKTSIFYKILQTKRPLGVNDLSPDEKKSLFALMVRNGASAGFAYDRFFQKGFQVWELDGINTIKCGFLKDHEQELLESVDEDGTKGYAYALSLDDSKGGFWRAIGQVPGLISEFKNIMHEKGMMSDVTIIKRFNADDWKQYELIGVRQIISDFVKEQKGAA